MARLVFAALALVASCATAHAQSTSQPASQPASAPASRPASRAAVKPGPVLVIDHNESERAVPAGEAVQISARIRSQLSNISARLFFRATGDKKFHLAPMQRVEGPRFAARVPTFAVVPPALEYYIEANAGSARTTKGSASSPLHLPVVGQEIADPGSGKPPWYKRWYVWVSLGIVVAGVTAAIIVATNQPDPNTQLP